VTPIPKGKAHQRRIREEHARVPDPLLAEKTALASWLGNMGTTDYSFGVYFGEHLAGVVCFGRTAGTNTAAFSTDIFTLQRRGHRRE
jgi:hypothetical protein